MSDWHVEGSLTLYRQFDVGYSIDLERAADLAGTSTRGRARPVRLEARALEIRNPPLVVALGDCDILIAGEMHRGSLAAHLFDFGVCSFQLRVPARVSSTWSGFVDFAAALDASTDPPAIFERELKALLPRIDASIERRDVAPLFEEYKVYRIDRISVDGRKIEGAVAAAFPDAQVVPLLVGERRPVAAVTLRELVPFRFSYYDDDLTVLSWETALIVEPRAEDRDIEYVL